MYHYNEHQTVFSPITLDTLDRNIILDTLKMSLEWIDNLAAAQGTGVVLNSMPNNCGGRHQIKRAIEKLEREE